MTGRDATGASSRGRAEGLRHPPSPSRPSGHPSGVTSTWSLSVAVDWAGLLVDPVSSGSVGAGSVDLVVLSARTRPAEASATIITMNDTPLGWLLFSIGPLLAGIYIGRVSWLLPRPRRLEPGAHRRASDLIDVTLKLAQMNALDARPTAREFRQILRTYEFPLYSQSGFSLVSTMSMLLYGAFTVLAGDGDGKNRLDDPAWWAYLREQIEAQLMTLVGNDRKDGDRVDRDGVA